MFKLNTEYKRIYDHIHGYIMISNLAKRVIDSIEFQRLRKLKQLGTCSYVFPNGIHTRFEHSIGTYYLAGRIMKCIMSRTPPHCIEDYLKNISELSDYYKRKYDGKKYVLDNHICELVKIAGLCHDLGHGPFSHVFDDVFLPNVKNKSEVYNSHEERSGLILQHIIQSDNILSQVIHKSDLQFIKNLINPKKENTGFLFQIVSNYLNGLDVDKYDYIVRDSYDTGIKISFDFSRLVDDVWVIDNTICYYPKTTLYEAIKLYQSRYTLHKIVYSHKAVISAQAMIVEILILLDDILKLSDSVNDVNKFCKLTDEYILTSIDHLTQPYCILTPEQNKAVMKAAYISERLNKHDLYVFVDSVVCDFQLDLKVDDFRILSDFDHKFMDDIYIYHTKIGFVSGNKKNPLDELYSCTVAPNKDNVDYKQIKLKKISSKEITRLIPQSHQEHITMIFYKKRDDSDGKHKIKKWFEELVNIKLS